MRGALGGGAGSPRLWHLPELRAVLLWLPSLRRRKGTSRNGPPRPRARLGLTAAPARPGARALPTTPAQALQQYAACQSHAFMKGIGAFLAGSGAAFAVQKLVNKKLPYSLQWSLLLAGGECPARSCPCPAAGSLASYAVTRAETQKCSDFWIYLETGTSPQELAVASRVSQPAENLPSSEDGESTAPLLRRNKYGDIVE
ncbi:transmembrane protein 141 isoform X2 [Phalacrocorax aristotelis]|uniref:transmembrane protein 141 isoform X2 n=1 Tax=Phalacrocorax aristotelis TaxID=126867 RepID=UPI003F4B2331